MSNRRWLKTEEFLASVRRIRLVAVWKTAATCTAAAIRLLVDLPWLNGMFEMFHVYPLPVKLNSLQLQACSLLVCSGAAQSYHAAGTYDAMPRQLICRIGA